MQMREEGKLMKNRKRVDLKKKTFSGKLGKTALRQNQSINNDA